ncbi:unnamed protein product [Allacma fusca]|uniref:Uncharacterized protein n=1 Tax=Allacma fusca TaxID=39272 RepID=A0A8J2JV36_9HEXA|nr:unnamed protein product [Allacma fusca]
MGSAFSTKTIYQFIGTLESVFGIVILAFGINTLVLYHTDTTLPPAYKDREREFVEYAAIAACGQSIIQILAAVLLVIKSEYNTETHGKDIHPGLVPKIWILLSLIQFAIQLGIFLTPTLMYNLKDNYSPNPENEHHELTSIQKSLREFFNYILVSAFFKIFFIWGVSSTMKSPKRARGEGPLYTKDLEKSDED